MQRYARILDTIIVVLLFLLGCCLFAKFLIPLFRTNPPPLPSPFQIRPRPPSTPSATVVPRSSPHLHEAKMAEALFIEAAHLIDAGNIGTAEPLLLRARALCPDDPRFAYLLSTLPTATARRAAESDILAAMAASSPSDVWNLFTNAASADPMFFDRHAMRLITFFEQSNEPASAVSLLRTHLKRKPLDTSAFDTWQRLTRRLGHTAGVVP
ncbi:MAG TPA: hypothetical protein PLP29_04060 [Candidatus Ozemobacteraceae bacterium]|nr:hypothetical protein [Candidatus Ozemobacteraceae bacterium]